MRGLLIIILLFITSCKGSFDFLSDYRDFPVAVDCDNPSDINLNFHKQGLPSVHVDQSSIEFKIINNDNGGKRSVCVFSNLSVRQFCSYKEPRDLADAVPYWIDSYSRVGAVKCSEALK